MVAYRDGSVLAQLGSPDMRTPIAYALGWPKRISAPADRLDFAKMRELTFEAPDSERFPALRLARSVLQAGGQAPTILNAANEIGVAAFLDRKIAFTDIAVVVESVLDEMGNRALGSLADVLETDLSARQVAQRQVAARLRNV
jgi:1-deoxy-D-xylulose-5-phosphate reductoisomerase